MHILYEDCLSNIIDNLSIHDILLLEQTSKIYKIYIEIYIKNKYKKTLIKVKYNLFNYYNDLDTLTNLLNNNKSIFYNISLYYKSINIVYYI